MLVGKPWKGGDPSMPTATITNFVDSLRDCRLVKAEQAEEITRTLRSRFSDSRGLAKELVRRGWLTVYQVNHLFQGRGDELLLGPYRILDRLGEGGISQVFKARHSEEHWLAA